MGDAIEGGGLAVELADGHVAEVRLDPDIVFEDCRARIVDDQRSMRLIVRRLLNDIGIRDIIEGSSGEDALENIQIPNEKAPDMVICGLYMEHMDELEFSTLVRRQKVEQLAGIPILILTGEQDKMIVDVARQAGATKVLSKSISAPELKTEIAAAIEFG